MAKSKFEYTKLFEADDTLLPNCWAVIRIDGRGFHKFTTAHGYEKPNDERGLGLMNRCAECVMKEFGDLVIAYGESDEYSFVLKRDSKLFRRRASKLVSCLTSHFTSCFVFYWSEFFADHPLQYPPIFDGRAVCYPTDRNLRDYLSWRQADTHINNLYNTCFWLLVKQGVAKTEAEQLVGIKHADAASKNELLFHRFGINYSDLPAQYRKGSIWVYDTVEEIVQMTGGPAVERARAQARAEGADESASQVTVAKAVRKRKLVLKFVDLIGDRFWADHPEFTTPS